jgi:hypothetical protein
LDNYYSAIFAAIKWDVPFEWETKVQSNGSCIKRMTVQGAYGPASLRKVIAPKSQLLMNQSKMSSWVVTSLNSQQTGSLNDSETEDAETLPRDIPKVNTDKIVSGSASSTKNPPTTPYRSSAKSGEFNLGSEDTSRPPLGLPPRSVSTPQPKTIPNNTESVQSRQPPSDMTPQRTTSVVDTKISTASPNQTDSSKKVTMLSKMTSALSFRHKNKDKDESI